MSNSAFFLGDNSDFALVQESALAAALRTAFTHETGSGTETFTAASKRYQIDYAGKWNLLLSGEVPQQGARRVLNGILGSSNNLTVAPWTTINVSAPPQVLTANSTDVFAPDGTHTATKIVDPAASVNYSLTYCAISPRMPLADVLSFWLIGAVGGETPVIGMELGGTSVSYIRPTLTTAWKKFSFPITNPTASYVKFGADFRGFTGLSGAQSAQTYYVWGVQPEVTGGRGTPSETVSVGATSTPYHGANVDGVKYLDTLPANTVNGSTHVVTEATGAAIVWQGGIGGEITQAGGKTIHTFRGSGTFKVPPTGLTVDYLVVAGGGAGGEYAAYGGNGGGGAGGVLSGAAKVLPPSMSYAITVGAGGIAATAPGNGGNSVFDDQTAIGGGRGGDYDGNAHAGGSGGGGGYGGSTAGAGTNGQGYAGGNDPGATNGIAGGGGGAGGAGVAGGYFTDGVSGTGGIGVASSISGVSTYYAGGGGGSSGLDAYYAAAPYVGSGSGVDRMRGLGGAGGGGNGGLGFVNAGGYYLIATNGAPNTGGGGGGAARAAPGGRGGSGIVIISYTTPTNGVSAFAPVDHVGPLGVRADPAQTDLIGTTAAIRRTMTAAGWIPPAAATGGTITTADNYIIHTFTADGTFTIPAGGPRTVEYLVVGGGGGGGSELGGGGGAGGFLTGALALAPGAKTVTVGAGGAADTNGSNSVFDTITAIGGGRGGGAHSPYPAAGGSGGGGSINNYHAESAVPGAGTVGQGCTGGAGGAGGVIDASAGGGGAGGAGAPSVANTSGGAAGVGIASSISGASVFYAGGGGGLADGQTNPAIAGAGGNGGGGRGAYTGVAGVNGGANTGGGGGGGGAAGVGSGGSGIVIVRYLMLDAGGGTITQSGGYTIHTFTSSGTLTMPERGVSTVEYLVVGGGGSGGGPNGGGGGGGAGGMRTGTITLPRGPVSVIVGAGGAAQTSIQTPGLIGHDSILHTIRAAGGGGGGYYAQGPAYAGGSGGGGSWPSTTNFGTGIAGQGNNGGKYGSGSHFINGGGGGAGAVGGDTTNAGGGTSGVGGAGASSSISGAAVTYAGGGGGGSEAGIAGAGGAGGGGAGTATAGVATAGTANTGGGGGGAGLSGGSSGAGGSGIVIVRYPTTNYANPSVTVGTATGVDGTAASAASLTAVITGGSIRFPMTLGAAVRSIGVMARRKTGTSPVYMSVDDGVTRVAMDLHTDYRPYVLRTDNVANPVVEFSFDAAADAIELDFNTVVAGATGFDLAAPINVNTAAEVQQGATASNFSSAAGGVALEITPPASVGNSALATGGTITTANGFTIHTFTAEGPGTFTVPAGGPTEVEYLVVAGGGGGGGSGANTGGGGGGAGGVLTGVLKIGVGALPLYVGYGGNAGAASASGASGYNSMFGPFTAVGGGGGGYGVGTMPGYPGGSGGGGSYASGGEGVPGQGNAGGLGNSLIGSTFGAPSGGGGGAGGPGLQGAYATGGAGGPGVSSSISGAAVTYGGGGGGSCDNQGSGGGAGGAGGGGAGSAYQGNGTAGTANRGGGGGGGSWNTHTGGAGGSGIIIIRYRTPVTIFHWATWVDASNYTAVLSDGANLIARKRIDGANHDATIAWNREAGVPMKCCAAFDTTYGVRIWKEGVKGTSDATLTASRVGTYWQAGTDGNGANQDRCAHRYLRMYKTLMLDTACRTASMVRT